MENANDYFNAWMKNQNQAFEVLREQSERLQSFYKGAGAEQNPFEAWRKMALDAVGGADSDTLKESLLKTFGSSGAYQKLFELWQPVLESMQSKTFDPAAWQGLMDPARIKEVVDTLFNFDAEAMTRLQEQIRQFSSMFPGNFESFGKPWADAAMQNMQSLPQLMQGHPEVLMQMFHTLYGAFDSTIGRSFHIPAVGKDREKVELMARCMDDMSVYAAKNIEYQHVMYQTGTEAMQKVLAELALKAQSDEKLEKFADFFDLWISVNEKTFYELFQTADFSKLKGELLDAGLSARKNYFKLMEMHLFDLPIALRSEMDDLYKTIYELRKKVKKMESRKKEKRA